MKIIVLHGEDTDKSYARLTKFIDTAKSRGWEIVTDELPNTPSLFGIDRLIIYRDYRKLTKNDINNFDRFEGTLVVYHNSDLPLSFIKLMPADFKMEKFDLPKLLFSFLENLNPGSSERSIKLFHEVLKTSPVELVFFFVARHFRDLYWVLTDPESSGFPSWKSGKLKSQALKFSVSKLSKIIEILAEIDVKVKLSKSNLTDELDLLIMKQLK